MAEQPDIQSVHQTLKELQEEIETYGKSITGARLFARAMCLPHAFIAMGYVSLALATAKGETCLRCNPSSEPGTTSQNSSSTAPSGTVPGTRSGEERR